MKKAVITAVLSAAVLAGCGGTVEHGEAAAPAAAARPSRAATIPVLRQAGTVTVVDPQESGGTPQPSLTETWKLTRSVYISHGDAVKGGADSDVAANLGANPLRPGDRYLVLGLTITNRGTGTITSGAWTVSAAGYGWAEPDGRTGTTSAGCLHQAPPGDSQLDPQFVSSMCSINGLQPGQSVSGYLFFEVPDAPAVLVVAEVEPEAGLLVVDPGGLVGKTSCVVAAKFC